jgi:site-specific DNA-methyltransferase (adenine-specific)
MTAPSTDAAKQWSGFGTALKPASEHWILVRKPCSEKTVAKNVLKHGVGGINIDGCRVGSGDDRTPGGLNSLSYETPTGTMNIRTNQTQRPSGGRFPANLVLSHTIFCTDDECDDTCAVKMLDEQSGHLLSSKRKPQTNSGHQNKYIGGDVVNKVPRIDYAGDGGASRFFYVAKASKSDRGAGNSHPTVKASKLMRYLIRLVTPPNGTVLDPFMGSGSTGVAAKQEGFNFIGIEREEDYLAIAQARMDAFL